MTEPGTKRSPTARIIWAILLVQVAIAAILFARDIARVLPNLAFAPDAPPLYTPTGPGDQTRRFDPARLPARPGRPGVSVPPTPDMPNRLQFEPDADDPTLVRLTGTIAPGDAERFADWLAITATPPTLVSLHSPGGSVTDALAIGQDIRALGAGTLVAADNICLSACPYLLASGTIRTAEDDALVGVHQHYFDENTLLPAFLAVEDIQRGQGAVLEYLIEMGIDPALMRHALVTPPQEIYLLTADEMAEYALTTPPGPDA